MKRIAVVLFGLLAVAASLFAGPDPALAQAKKTAAKDLPPQYRRWLEEEVVYIITPKEREVFLQLENDRDREVFIKAFWRQRDPTPDTDTNEFRDEHYRRITYANTWFGRDAPGPGWRTDMGRIYIILGEPKTIDRFENLTQVYPTVIWFYSGLEFQRLPSSFNVVFFKPEGQRSYVLYSPMRDGPQKLLIHYMGDMTDYMSAYQQMMDVEPAIAGVSLSLIPGEMAFSTRPSMSSDILIGNYIPAAASEKVKDDYAEKLLRYKDIVEVEYTANYIDSDAMLRVYRDASGNAFVHFLVEPSRLSVEPAGGGYRAGLEADVSVTDAAGGLVYQYNRSVPVDMTGDQLAAVRGKLFSYQDLFPLVPGSYRISILLKNRVSREFTSFETSVLVPPAGAFTLFAPCLANRADKASRFQGQSKPFLFGGLQLTPSPRNDFLPGDTLGAFFQLANAPADVLDGGVVEYRILKDEPQGTETVRVLSRPLSEYPDRTNVFEEFPLAGFPAANYILRVSVRDASRAERVAAEERFLVTPLPALMRPWVLSVPRPSNDPEYLHIAGTQYMNKKDWDKARPLLAAAVRRDPGSAPFALDYVRLLLELQDYAGAKAAAQTFLGDERKWDFLEPVGRAAQALGEYEPAIAFYKDYLAHFGANLNVLNAVGECYLRLGNAAEALNAWERSLKIEPNQPKLKERVRELQTKK
ncbi:MAG TPA: GWxTD domain-containing protein [Candidatus Aminicenantes bacterium]|nr:GWxTD domain-containing protein [Candidatus Aminicenantes bacterium]